MNNCVLGFNGERLDPVSGTTHLGNGYRAYNPVLMRFNSPDSMSPFGVGGINPYAYCAGDPVNQADPSGHWSLGQWIGLAVGIAAGIVLGIATAGAAMPAVLTLMALAAGGAAIGAGAELVTETVDGQQVNWGQVGISAGIGAVAELVGYGVGKGLSTAYKAIKGSLSGATGRLAAGAGYVPEQVAQYDRIALRGLCRGEGLPGGSNAEISRDMEIGRGGDGVTFDQGNGYVVKEFHVSMQNIKLQNEVDIFNRVYGTNSAEIISSRMIKMKKIPGVLISVSGVYRFSEENAKNLIGRVGSLHEMGIFHGDLNNGNILYDSTRGTFNLIDFGSSQVGASIEVLNSEMEELIWNINQWPIRQGQNANLAPSVIGDDGRVYI